MEIQKAAQKGGGLGGVAAQEGTRKKRLLDAHRG